MKDDRKLLIVEHGSGATTEIVAASAVFTHLEGRFREVGATRVVANGFGLQVLLYSVSIVHELLMEKRFQEIYCTAIRDNVVSIHNIQKSGFVVWPDPDVELREEKARLAKMAGRTANVAYFRLPREEFSHQAQRLLDYESEARLWCRSAEQTVQTNTLQGIQSVQLDLRVESLMYYREAVIKLAKFGVL